MDSSISKEDLVFNYRTLRLIIGALAFAFPSVVLALTGKITTSISASYYEPETRDVFVGFLFIIGGLLISYKGHIQGEPKRESETFWQWIVSFRWLKAYQEDIISTIGGFAAIFTALYPTACDGCAMNSRAVIHTTGAFILFSTVVYFSLIAFLRSLNDKLVEDNPDFKKLADTVRSVRKISDVDSVRKLGYLVFRNISIFLIIANKISRDYDRNNTVQIARALRDDKDKSKEVKQTKPNKIKYMWLAYGKKITRGYVYVVCGILIAATLLAFIILSVAHSSLVAYTVTTFVVETIALVLFGIAWMTASKLEYITTIVNWWEARQKKAAIVPKPEVALFNQDNAQETS